MLAALEPADELRRAIAEVRTVDPAQEVDPGSSAQKRKLALTLLFLVLITFFGCLRIEASGAVVSIVKASGSLVPVRPARSVPLTVIVCSPSSSGVAGTNGEEHGIGTASSTEQKKVTGRLATNATRGLGFDWRSAGIR